MKPINNNGRLINLGFTALRTSVLAIIASATANAATITWQAPQAISEDSDVVTSGTLVAAFNVGDTASNAIVNGVTFTSNTVTGTGSITVGTGPGALRMLASPGNYWGVAAAFGSSKPPFTALSSGYQTLLASAYYDKTTANQPAIFTITGLTVGQAYLVQFWVNDSRGTTSTSGRSNSYTADNASGGLDFNVGNFDGGLGQYVTGTFVADSTDQAISVSADFESPSTASLIQLNAYQLRAITIPEPSTLPFVGAGFILLVTLAWNRRGLANSSEAP